MTILTELLRIITKYDEVFFSDIQLILLLYLFMFILLFLENAILPLFFLPGDSLLIVLGIFIERGILSFFITLVSLTVAVSLGSWVSYLQGKFLKNGRTFHRWLSYLPDKSYQKSYYMLNKHGLFALFIGRFIAFIRTALPMIAGVSGLNSFRFQLYNWVSAFVWVLILIITGFFLGRVPFLFG